LVVPYLAAVPLGEKCRRLARYAVAVTPAKLTDATSPGSITLSKKEPMLTTVLPSFSLELAAPEGTVMVVPSLMVTVMSPRSRYFGDHLPLAGASSVPFTV
jgi:hypothetical protein